LNCKKSPDRHEQYSNDGKRYQERETLGFNLFRHKDLGGL
jgi:hypothetical protein